MENKVILSIVVPVYNVEKYLDKCLISIIENYTQGIEVVLVNDGSKDGSGKICDKYASEYDYIKVINKENGGLSSARNAGINEACGKYIWCVDSDDYIKQKSIQKIIEKAEKNVDLIISSHCNFAPDGSVLDDSLEEPTEKNITAYEYFHNIGSASYAAYRFIVKKELILEKDLFFTEGIYHEDEDWTPRVLCSAKKFIIISGSIYMYRTGNPQSIMGMLNSKKVYDKIYVSKKIYNKIKNETLNDKMSNFLKYRIEHNFIAALNEVDLYSGTEKLEIIKEIKDSMYVLDGINSTKAKLIKVVLLTMGIKNTSKLLKIRSLIK